MDSNFINLDYYDVLEVSRNATYEEIRQSYQQLLLKYHPDKSCKSNHDIYIILDRAWNTLRSKETRKIYDAEILQNKFNNDTILFATITLKECHECVETGQYIYNCRCGGTYIFTRDMEVSNTRDIIISCTDCSLAIQLILNIK